MRLNTDLKSMKPKVSVVTPFHNDEQFLAATLESILAQTFTDWELLLVDDASTDSSSEIALGFARRDSRINYFRLSQNGGAAVARNLGIDKASGRFIAFLDADDLWHPDKLNRQLSFMQREKAALSCTSYDQIDEATKPIGRRVTIHSYISYRQMLSKNYVGCLTAMLDLSQTGKIYMPNLRKRQDYGLWLKVIKNCGPARGLNEVLAYYRCRQSSISSNKLEMIRYNWQLMHEIEGLNPVIAAWYLSRQIYNRIFQ